MLCDRKLGFIPMKRYDIIILVVDYEYFTIA